MGSLYIGSTKVCPVVVVNSPLPAEYFTFKFPDSLTELEDEISFSDATFPFSGVVVDFNKISSISGDYAVSMFLPSSKTLILKNINSITSITGSACFSGFCNSATLAQGYEDIYFGELTTVGQQSLGQAFTYWTNISSIHFDKLTSIAKNAFYGMLQGCSGVGVYFPAVTSTTLSVVDCLNRIANSASNITLHFPSNVSSAVETLTGYPNFNGTNTTILYDLEATE